MIFPKAYSGFIRNLIPVWTAFKLLMKPEWKSNTALNENCPEKSQLRSNVSCWEWVLVKFSIWDWAQNNALEHPSQLPWVSEQLIPAEHGSFQPEGFWNNSIFNHPLKKSPQEEIVLIGNGGSTTPTSPNFVSRRYMNHGWAKKNH